MLPIILSVVCAGMSCGGHWRGFLSCKFGGDFFSAMVAFHENSCTFVLLVYSLPEATCENL